LKQRAAVSSAGLADFQNAIKELSADKLDNIVLGFGLNLADPIEQNRRHSSAMLRIL
jgi:hypothetical protein